MNNIIIPVTSEDMLEFVESLKKKNDLYVLVGVTKSLEDKIKKTRSKNFCLSVFEDGAKKEEIINSLKDKTVEGKIVICRKEISLKELDLFLSSTKDIAVCKENRSKFKNFCFGIWQKVMKFLFGFEFFDGDVSVISFNENLYPVIKNIENLSYVSRINKWKNSKIDLIETNEQPCKMEYDKTMVNLKFYGFLALFLAVIASCVVYFIFIKATFLSALLFAVAIFIALIFAFIETAIFYMNLRVGQRLFKRAKVNN